MRRAELSNCIHHDGAYTEGETHIHIKTQENPNWNNDDIQFPRLIAELMATGAFNAGVMDNLCDEMDLEVSDILEIIERAQAKWDNFKSKL